MNTPAEAAEDTGRTAEAALEDASATPGRGSEGEGTTNGSGEGGGAPAARSAKTISVMKGKLEKAMRIIKLYKEEIAKLKQKLGKHQTKIQKVF